MDLKTAIELFLNEHKASTREAYTRPLYMLRDWIGPSRPLALVSPPLLTEYVQEVIKKRNYRPATEQKHIKTIKIFFNWCLRLEMIERSPARVLRARKPPRRISRDKAMPDADLARILERLRYKTSPRDYALLRFLADTGCRRAGAAGLKLSDLDLARLQAVVTEKGDKSRPVAFSQLTAEAITHWLAYRSQRFAIRGVYVFTRDGLAMKAENVSLIVRRACRAAGVPVRSAHSLRHRKGHQFADARIAPSIAATALGHSDPVITLQHYYPDDWETAEQALRELMRIAPSDDKAISIRRAE